MGKSLAIQIQGGQDPSYAREPAHGTALIVGIARDVVNGWTDTGRDVDCIYFPTATRTAHNGSLLVRANGRKAIEQALDRLAPSVADFISPMDDAHALQSYPYRVMFWISGLLGGLALALTVSGIYGVLSYLVGQRTREIGIRVALGAATSSVIAMVMRQSIRLAGIGTIIGMTLSLAAAPAFASSIAALNPFDLTAYVGGAALVVAAAVCAAFDPSRRAAGIDPAITLRSD
jgi:ABC-type antimicrobial peptide transport system permease subunit